MRVFLGIYFQFLSHLPDVRIWDLFRKERKGYLGRPNIRDPSLHDDEVDSEPGQDQRTQQFPLNSPGVLDPVRDTQNTTAEISTFRLEVREGREMKQGLSICASVKL